MAGYFTLAAAVLGLAASPTAAFAPAHAAQRQSSSTELFVGYSLEPPSEEQQDILARARQCAQSELCSIDDARDLLQDILQIQSTCDEEDVSSPICANQDVAAEVVSSLRYKIDHAAVATMAKARPLSIPANIVGSALTALAITAMASMVTTLQPEATPFTLQEWWWALQGGYLDDMVHHYMKHGGLLVGDDSLVSAFTMQEWMWAVRDGYLPRIMADAYQHGGLEMAAADKLSSLTPQEFVWALQGGYLDRALSSSGLETDMVSRPLSAEEWMWSVRDGYLPLLIRSWYSQGGMM